MKKLALAFSGGKDSLACWYLMRHLDPLVLWVNTGKVYPETLEIINLVRNQTQNFIEILVDKEGQNVAHGLPSDIVPINLTSFAKYSAGQKEVRVQSYLQCCIENITNPLNQAIKKFEVTHIIRGQRKDEKYKGNVSDGDVVDGVTVIQPIEDWSAGQVLDYIEQFMEIPAHFILEHSSMDCYDCTAYVNSSHDRKQWTKLHHPELYKIYNNKLQELQGYLLPEFAALTSLCEE